MSHRSSSSLGRADDVVGVSIIPLRRYMCELHSAPGIMISPLRIPSHYLHSSNSPPPGTANNDDDVERMAEGERRRILLCVTTIAYGLGELMGRHAPSSSTSTTRPAAAIASSTSSSASSSSSYSSSTSASAAAMNGGCANASGNGAEIANGGGNVGGRVAARRASSSSSMRAWCEIDNYAVRVISRRAPNRDNRRGGRSAVPPRPVLLPPSSSDTNDDSTGMGGPASGGGGGLDVGATTWRDIVGLDAMHPRGPRMSVDIIEPSFLGAAGDDECIEEEEGRYLEAEFPHHPPPSRGGYGGGTNGIIDDREGRGVGMGGRDGGDGEEEEDEEMMGIHNLDQNEEDARCYAYGLLLYELYAFQRTMSTSTMPIHMPSSCVDANAMRGVGYGLGGHCPPPRMDAGRRGIDDAADRDAIRTTNGPAKKRRVRSANNDASSSSSEEEDAPPHHRSDDIGMIGGVGGRDDVSSSLRMGGNVMSMPSSSSSSSSPPSYRIFPQSVFLVIRDLLDCGESNRPDYAYNSLEDAIRDVHLLLLDPSHFLFDIGPSYDEYGRPTLSLREHRLYGREDEVSLITDAFCRVSTRTIESVFIGGFSGSGKTRLFHSLTARIDAAGGYILKHKFDEFSRDRTMHEVIALFNDLCQLIRKKNDVVGLRNIGNDLQRVFGSDMSVLVRLLPNVRSLLPAETTSDDDRDSADNLMNVRSICFILQRFIGVVSCVEHPVVFFLDDLQWCDMSGLLVMESAMCDPAGSACLFFVGTYRSNEVDDDHEIFGLVRRLKSFGVPTTMVSLEGLDPKNLNTMISDALCMLPRACTSLSDIVYQKTKGNPFFVLAFLRSLVDGRYLWYCVDGRRWIWDEDHVSSLDVTGNVLHLLSSKMTGLSTSMQSALKVAACFGIRIEQSVVSTLVDDPEFADIRDNLVRVVREGFMVMSRSSDFKFVHDKVREAAYGLIPEMDRDAYHYKIGMSLYLTTKGKVVDDILFFIADQIKHGIGYFATENPELRIDIAKLYELSGIKAAASPDYLTSRSYMTHALSVLPLDRWKSHYDLSHRFSIRLAKSCYSCGDIERAQSILEEITQQCPSIMDKYPAHALQARILLDRRSYIKAYDLCHEVLSQLGEDLPDSIDHMPEMVEETLEMVKNISSRDLLEMKEMDEKFTLTMNYFSIIITAAFFARPEIVPFIACRMVQITMKNGLCNFSIMGFLQIANVLCSNMMAKKKVDSNSMVKKNIASASRIGKAAMYCSETRYHASGQLPNLYTIYYGFIAPYTEPLQTCASMLRRGFEAGMSLGEIGIAFLNSILHMRTAIVAGERLPALLDRVDYYLEQTNTYQNEIAKVYLTIQRNTISALIENKETTDPTQYQNDTSMETNANLLESIYFHHTILAFWEGHNERCQYYIRKFFLCLTYDTWRLQFITFIEGMNSFQLLRSRSTEKLIAVSKKAVRVLKTAASNCHWNFGNKLLLLQAEQFSFQSKNSAANMAYAAAINSAHSSGFIHEQGLACELAGYHYNRICDFSTARSYFDQAKQCYTEWGCQLKVENVTRRASSLTTNMPHIPSAASSSLGSVGGDSGGGMDDANTMAVGMAIKMVDNTI